MSSERSKSRTGDPCDEPAEERSTACSDGSTAQRSGDDPRAEWKGFCAAGSRGKLIDHELAEGQRREDPWCDCIAKEGERRGGDIEPADARSPTDSGRCGHGAQACNESNQQRQDKCCHRSILVLKAKAVCRH